MLRDEPITLSAALAIVTRELEANGYRVTRELELSAFPESSALLAEDEYGVVGLVGYETWQDLEQGWATAQGELVQLMSSRLARSEPKIWDGYLVLLCQSVEPDDQSIKRIERDTTRVRKVIATANSLRTTADLKRLIELFLPIEMPDDALSLTDALASLPDLLRDEVNARDLAAVIQAFREMEPPLERLHDLERNE